MSRVWLDSNPFRRQPQLRLEDGDLGWTEFARGWVTVALALVSALSASGQGEFTCEALTAEGRRTVARVLLGKDAKHESYPWQVAMIWRYTEDEVRNGKEPFQFCGGSLIHKGWVLTAAHCVMERARYGLARLPVDRIEIRHGTDVWKDSGEATVRGVAEIHVHPEYDGHPQHGSDIALLRLSRPIENSRKSYASLLVKPSQASKFVFPGACAVVTGWGYTREGDKSSGAEHLQAASVPIMDQRACRQDYSYRETARISDGEVCAGLPGGGRDACKGDSGGPLVVEGLGRGHYVLAGVVSWGDGCGQAGKPGVYARVSYHMPWILRTVAGE